jgi:hypothetical protein
MKCQLAQGFLFSKPLHKEKMEELIENMDRFACLNPNLHYNNPSNDAPPDNDPEKEAAAVVSGLRGPFR